jgi:prepilin-type N-terminal cleavage/methylation domain-containing protein
VKRTSGFTLVEVMMGLVITGVVALLVYGAIRTAADTQASLAAGRSAVRAEMAWRAIITDAVRNVRAPTDYGAPTLRLESGEGPDGRPADRLVLVTAASTPPLTTGTDWQVSVAPGPSDLIAEAVPLGRRGQPLRIRGPTGVTGLDVQALGVGSARWRDSWTTDRSLPRALRITFWTDEGPAPRPLLVSLPLGSGP